MTSQRARRAARAACPASLPELSDAGGMRALTQTGLNVLLPRAVVTTIWQHPGEVRDAR